MEDINKYAKENVLKFVVGNKSDLVQEKEVKYEEARALASEMNATYFNVSAKENENINEFFESATRIFLIKYNLYVEEENRNVILDKRQSRSSTKRKSKNKEEEC